MKLEDVKEGGSEIPVMLPRRGKRGTDRQLAGLLQDALDNLASCPCSFWACKGAKRRPEHMTTCTKCYAMRQVATVLASLQARGQEQESPNVN